MLCKTDYVKHRRVHFNLSQFALYSSGVFLDSNNGLKWIEVRKTLFIILNSDGFLFPLFLNSNEFE